MFFTFFKVKLTTFGFLVSALVNKIQYKKCLVFRYIENMMYLIIFFILLYKMWKLGCIYQSHVYRKETSSYSGLCAALFILRKILKSTSGALGVGKNPQTEQSKPKND
jgi:hypothetical protein